MTVVGSSTFDNSTVEIVSYNADLKVLEHTPSPVSSQMVFVAWATIGINVQGGDGTLATLEVYPGTDVAGFPVSKISRLEMQFTAAQGGRGINVFYVYGPGNGAWDTSRDFALWARILRNGDPIGGSDLNASIRISQRGVLAFDLSQIDPQAWFYDRQTSTQGAGVNRFIQPPLPQPNADWLVFASADMLASFGDTRPAITFLGQLRGSDGTTYRPLRDIQFIWPRAQFRSQGNDWHGWTGGITMTRLQTEGSNNDSIVLGAGRSEFAPSTAGFRLNGHEVFGIRRDQLGNVLSMSTDEDQRRFLYPGAEWRIPAIQRLNYTSPTTTAPERGFSAFEDERRTLGDVVTLIGSNYGFEPRTTPQLIGWSNFARLIRSKVDDVEVAAGLEALAFQTQTFGRVDDLAGPVRWETKWISVALTDFDIAPVPMRLLAWHWDNEPELAPPPGSTPVPEVLVVPGRESLDASSLPALTVPPDADVEEQPSVAATEHVADDGTLYRWPRFLAVRRTFRFRWNGLLRAQMESVVTTTRTTWAWTPPGDETPIALTTTNDAVVTALGRDRFTVSLQAVELIWTGGG
jgi:hypothetical protein